MTAIMQVMAGSGFGPSALFADGSQGAWYDPSDFSTLFQNSAGTTPVTAVEQPVRLMLDKSKGLVLGPELKSAWASSATWVGGAGVVFSGSSIDFDAQSDRARTDVTANTTYSLTFGGTFAGGGTFTVDDDGVGAGLASVTDYVSSRTAGATVVFRTTASTRLRIIQVSVSGTISITSFSLKEVLGNHATAPNDASRPVLRSRYNLLTYSEQFDNAVWAKITTTVTANTDTAPDGTVTADTVAATGANSLIYQVVSGLSNSTTYTLSVWVRTITVGTTATLAFYTAGGGTTIGSQSFTTTGSWQRVTLTATTGTLSGETWFAIGGVNTFATGETFYIWGAQLLTAADQSATGGAYQRIAAATDYDTSNPVWRPYLAFDGSDDTMTIASSIHDVFQNVGGGTMWAGYMGAVTDKSLLTFTGGAGTARAIMLVDRTVGRRLDADSIVSASDAGFTANSIYVGTTINDWSGGNLIRRRNGAQVASSAYAAAGNTSNTASTVARIGADGAGTGSFLNGRIYSLIVLGRTATTAELTSTETWVNGKTGAY